MEKQKRMKKRIDWNRIITIIVLSSLILSVGFTILHLLHVLKPAEIAPGVTKSDSDYLLMLSQCILAIAVMFVPTLLNRTLHIRVPNGMYLILVLFLFCAVYLGEVRRFYYIFPNWDTVIHTFSGAMLGALGFSVVHLLSSNEKTEVNLSPLFIAIFAFCFACTLGALWEIYEFTLDSVMGMNMQKYAIENGTPLIGREALFDTMEDIIVDTIGAAVMAVIGYFSIRKNNNWFESFGLARDEDATDQKAAD